MLVKSNCDKLYDDFALIWFDMIPKDDSKRSYHTDYCPTSIAKKEGFTPLVGDTREPVTSDAPGPIPQNKKADAWEKHKVWMVHIPKKYSENEEKLRRIISSPIMTTECAELVEDYLSTTNKNIHIFWRIIDECKCEMRERYPSFDRFSISSYDWIWVRFNGQSEKLEPKARAIVEYCRKYFQSDEILGKQKQTNSK